MNTPRTDKLVEMLSVEPWLSTETKCRELHNHAEKLEVESDTLRAALMAMREYYKDHKIKGSLFNQVEAALSLENSELCQP
tara:strand:- start:1448 stop:1690 length:243 start_codon:yes stop_codon:yes gene_type:complete